MPVGVISVSICQPERVTFDYITNSVGSALPSDLDKAMREAPDGRTVKDTDSYAFSIP